jgi:hypothetical protein
MRGKPFTVNLSEPLPAHAALSGGLPEGNRNNKNEMLSENRAQQGGGHQVNMGSMLNGNMNMNKHITQPNITDDHVAKHLINAALDAHVTVAS